MTQILKARSATKLLATDRLGSILRQHSEQGALNFIYTPFGYDQLKKTLTSVLGFNAQPRDCSRWYLLGNGYRAYNPALMVFMGADQHSPFGKGGLNGYAYCNGDPVNQQDPTGEAGGPTMKFQITPETIRYIPELEQPLQIGPVALQPAHLQINPPEQLPANRPLAQNRSSIDHRQQELVVAPANIEESNNSTLATQRMVRSPSRRERFIEVFRSGFRRVIQRVIPRLRPSAQIPTAPPHSASHSAARMYALLRQARSANNRNISWSTQGVNGGIRTEN
ncbi:RHS repeat-associated core domain-containing protein [Pseudomonas mosselii]|uniref:RHS repeat-associated core domain-containing protein n=1 Tax=Pseudomonas mosselii TaxID=78327 RepID=UPI003F3DBC9E